MLTRPQLVVSNDAPEAPYPADTRAGSYRLQLDMERVEQSDTMAMAPDELRPWLLWLWASAWRQIPMASFPADDELIAARIRMPLTAFQTHKAVLLRGWRKHSDGRLYHDYLTGVVLEMLRHRRNHADVVKRRRQPSDSNSVTNQSPVTDSMSRSDVDVDVDVDVDKSSSKALSPQAAPAAQKPVLQKATRLPSDWQIPDAWVDWAVGVHGLEREAVIRLSLRFRDFWIGVPGKDGCKLDWFATWRNKVRKECGQ